MVDRHNPSALRARSRHVSRLSLAGGALGIAALLGLAACGGGSDDTPAATPAPNAQNPGTGGPAPGQSGTPTQPTAPPNGQWTADAASSNAARAVFYYDANGNAARDGTERFVVQNLNTGHYYELVSSAYPIAFASAKALAYKAGGALFVGDGGAAEIEFVRAALNVETDKGRNGLPVTSDNPSLGAWIGLENPTPSDATPNVGWKWIGATAAAPGTDFTEASNGWSAWIVHPRTQCPNEPNGCREPNGKPFGAMTGGNTVPGGETQVLFNMADSDDPSFAVRKYVIEYPTAAVILATPPATAL